MFACVIPRTSYPFALRNCAVSGLCRKVPVMIPYCEPPCVPGVPAPAFSPSGWTAPAPQVGPALNLQPVPKN